MVRRFRAQCGECGWHSPPGNSEQAAERWRRWHAAGHCDGDEIEIREGVHTAT